MTNQILAWLFYSILTLLPIGAIAGYTYPGVFLAIIKNNCSLKPQTNPIDNGRLYLALVSFAVAQSCYFNYSDNGLGEVFVRIIASLIIFGPLAFGLGYYIRKNNLPK